MKNHLLIFLILGFILVGCDSQPSDADIQTAIAETAIVDIQGGEDNTDIREEEEIPSTPTPLPSETPVPTLSGEEWFHNNVKVSSIFTFEAGQNPANAATRDYGDTFTQEDTRVIYCDIDLTHSAPEDDITFLMEAKYYGPNGEIYGQEEITSEVKKGWITSNWIIGHGWDTAGNWGVGEYTVEVLVDDQVIGSNTFNIILDTPTPQPTNTSTPGPGAIVDTESLNIRSGPDTVYNIVGSASKGDNLDIIGKAYNCSWLMIETTDGVEGWVASDLVIFELECSDIPAASIPPTPIPLPTLTPTTQAPQGKTVNVKIINNTGGTLTLNLTGPATYSFTLGPGTHTIQVIPGTYTYTAWGCGATASGTKKLSKGDEWTWFCE